MSDEQYLESLFVKYGTDKGRLGGQGWGYTPYYSESMGKQRLRVKQVLEIGICGYRDIPNNVVGASLFVWRDYFPNAQIYGLDNDSRFIFNDQPRIHTALCDAYDPVDLARALAGMGNPRSFDMIVDDAVHDPENQLLLLNRLGDRLKYGGRYFIEDCCPVKVPDGHFTDWLIPQIKTEITSVHACVTPKPEELVLCIK